MPVPAPPRGCSPVAPTHLGVVGDGALGYRALFLYQEAEPSPLFCESRLVTVRDVVLQLALLVADGFNILEGKEAERQLPSLLCPSMHGAGDAAASSGEGSAPRPWGWGGSRACRGPLSTGHAHMCLRGPSNRPYSLEPPRRGADSARGQPRTGGRTSCTVSSRPLTKRAPAPRHQRPPRSPRAANGPHSPRLIPSPQPPWCTIRWDPQPR